MALRQSDALGMELEQLSSGQDAEMVVEQESIDCGLTLWQNRTARLEAKGLATHTDAGRRLLKLSIEPTIEGIEEFLKDAQAKPGRKALAYRYVSLVSAPVAAFITARCVYDGIAMARTLQKVVGEIGSKLEDEVRFTQFHASEPRLFNKVKANLADHHMGYQDKVRRSMLNHTANKFSVQLPEWSYSDKIHIGRLLLDIFIAKVGLVEMVTQRTGKRTILLVHAKPELTEIITNMKLAKSEVLTPYFQPMICPPLDWIRPKGAGYLMERCQTVLVKNFRGSYQHELQGYPMPKVYEAVNALQRTPWRINGAMLTLVREIWEAGLELKGMPSRFDTPLPAKPTDYETNPQARTTWKKTAGDIFRMNEKAGSKRMQVAKIMYLADKFEQYPAIWFPINLDFRGRMYATPLFLNPQGSDLAKSLLTFAQGKPLGKDGVFWLGVHLANTFGYDKCSLKERHAWALVNSSRIESCANDPLEDRWWMEAEKPFQFLAACIEWLGFLHDGGEDYVCSLPIMVDGSCNGLQHFSAMLRDEVGGRHVNLIPQDKPADIYQAVADAVMDKLKESTEEFAAGWHGFGIDRKTCKRPVMVLPYGGTREAVRAYIYDAVMERIIGGQANPFGDKLRPAIQYLATLVWRTMAEVIIGARQVMDWLRDVARQMTKQKQRLNWLTPTGFWVQQGYLSTRHRSIQTMAGDRLIQISIREQLPDKLDSRKQVQAVAPNFVHSLDASALMLTICAARSKGLEMFAAVHDSYGTLAADTQALQETLRQCFVEMYQSHDVLAEFRSHAPADLEIAPQPPAGSLDLAGVLRSDFFFA